MNSISVIIPTFNRPEQLDRCLTALGRSHLPARTFQVLVVDDGGSTPLDAIVSRHAARLNARLVTQRNTGPAGARNAGAALAQGDLLVFTDDDCLPEPDWLASLARVAAENPGSLIGGNTVNHLVENPFATASQLLISYLYEYSETRGSEGRWRPFFASNNIAVPARGFHQLGGFDVGFPLAAGEDRDFCDRWTEVGFATVFAPDAIIRHAHALSFSAFWRQHWNYGRGAVHFHRARAGRGATAFRPEPPAFYIDLLLYPLRNERSGRGILHTTLLGVSQIANAAGYVRERAAGDSTLSP